MYPVVGNGLEHADLLQGGARHALPEHQGVLGRWPPVLRRGEHPSGLTGQPQPGGLAHAELAQVVVQRVVIQLFAVQDGAHIARLGQHPGKGEVLDGMLLGILEDPTGTR